MILSYSKVDLGRITPHIPHPTSSSPQSDTSSEDRIIAQHLDELSIQLERERTAPAIPGIPRFISYLRNARSFRYSYYDVILKKCISNNINTN